MAASYDPAQLANVPLYQVRFRLGDTDVTDATFQDEEIIFALGINHNDVLKTCIDCINVLLPRLASMPDIKVGPYTEKGDTKAFDYWEKLLAELKAKVSSHSAPIMANPTGSEIFGYGMMNNKKGAYETPPKWIEGDWNAD